MHIAVFGLGYVGLTTAACLVRQGYSVVGFDPNDEKCRQVNEGRSPVFEPGLGDLIEWGAREGRLKAAPHPTHALLDNCDLAMVCVGTPSSATGAHNMSFITQVARQIAQICENRTRPLTVAFRSTIPPGTMERVVAPFFDSAIGTGGVVELAYNPEFLRESSAIDDYFHPPKIVVGTADGRPSATMAQLYAGIDAPTFITGFREAELTKFVDNSFHALKVVFANEIGRVCASLGVDASKVHDIFVSDTKLNISPRYFRPGGAFGGSCLPKDVRALSHLAAEAGVATPMIDNLIPSNEAHKDFLLERAVAKLAPGAKILVVGLAFKANSDDLRESPHVDMTRKLLQRGFEMTVYDPAIDPASLLGANLGYAFTHLPVIRTLLVTREQAEADAYDLVIDSNGEADRLNINTARVYVVGRIS